MNTTTDNFSTVFARHKAFLYERIDKQNQSDLDAAYIFIYADVYSYSTMVNGKLVGQLYKNGKRLSSKTLPLEATSGYVVAQKNSDVKKQIEFIKTRFDKFFNRDFIVKLDKNVPKQWKTR